MTKRKNRPGSAPLQMIERPETPADQWDPEWLGARCGHEESFVRELIQEFLRGMPALIRRIETADQTNDAMALSHTAHTLKGGSLTLGANALAALCERLETAGKAGKLAECREVLPHLYRTQESLSRILKQHLDHLQSGP